MGAVPSGMRTGVVGAGIVGLAVARHLAGRGDVVTVIDKEPDVARHQTGRNSGVVHAGLYYPPGSLKSRLCRQGGDLLRAYCAERGIPLLEVGKLVIAAERGELGRLDGIEERATAAGVPDLVRVGPAGIADVEPHAAGVAALHSPHTGIVDFARVARSFAEDVTAAGGTLRLGHAVTAIGTRGDRVAVRTAAGDEVVVDRLVVCAGLQADRVARLAGDTEQPAIVPFRGEYHRLVPGREGLVRGLIYPVPDPAYPFLGVHFTRRVDGGVDVGPNAVLALAREGYRRRDLEAATVAELARSPAFRALAARHWRTGAREVLGSLSTRAFVAGARRFVPELTAADVEPAPAGVRAQAVDPDGSLVDDFRIGHRGPVTTVRNAPSPAATSALAIAEHLAEHHLGA
jgi:L-2-hydroxyglutarate oxidase LhgO